MGLFGTSPQKKLARARALLAQGDFYPAWQLFRELQGLSGRLSPEEISEARQGSVTCRRAMIDRRLQEAEALRSAGDLAGARDRCQTAFDLAGQDIALEAIEEVLQRINAPRRPVAAAPQLRDALEVDILPPPDETVTPSPSPLDRSPEPEPARSDEEIFGPDPESRFSEMLLAVEEPTAEFYRGLGADFRLGYVALNQGEGRRALDFFDRLDWSTLRDPRARLERAHALLLAERAEESLRELDALASSDLPAGEENRRRYLRVEALRALTRFEEAVAAARALAEEAGEPTPVTEALLAWTLLEAGRPQEAFDRLTPLMGTEDTPEEIVAVAAQAAGAAGLVEDEAGLLRRLIDMRMQRSITREVELEFPVESGRRLLEIYLDSGADPDDVRSLVLHLIDHDPERAEAYRSILLELDAAG